MANLGRFPLYFSPRMDIYLVLDKSSLLAIRLLIDYVDTSKILFLTAYSYLAQNVNFSRKMSTFLGKSSTFAEKHPIFGRERAKNNCFKSEKFLSNKRYFPHETTKIGRSRGRGVRPTCTQYSHKQAAHDAACTHHANAYLLIIWIVSTLSCHLKTRHEEGEVTQYSVLSKIKSK